jgi:uncharacterized protein involved in exopolysaccharide biosynthesis
MTLGVIVQHRRLIILNTLTVTIVAGVIAFLLPKEYQARTTILPPEVQTNLGGFTELSAAQVAQAVTNFSLPVLATPSDLYASMLKADRVLKEVVDSLNLADVYEVKSPWQAVKILRGNLDISVSPEGIVTAKVTDSDRERAAIIANLLVSTLDRLNRKFKTEKNKQYADFLTQRLEETERQLELAQERLREFQQENLAISIELQSQALIENLAQQKATLTAAEIELELLSQQLQPDHPEVVAKRRQVESLRRKLRQAERGTTPQEDSLLSALDIPLDKIPDLSLRLAILMRNVRIQELIYEMIAQQLEMAQMQEKHDIPIINVLDIARPPEIASSPRKALIITVAFFLTLMASVLLVVVYDYLNRLSKEGDPVFVQLRDIFRNLRRKPLG